MSNQRGAVLVEAPIAVAIVLFLAMGLTTLVQLAWTHLALSSAIQSTTRYATHVDYDPAAGTADRRRTEEQVRAWAEEVAAEANVSADEVTITGRHLPSGTEAPIDELVAGDEIVIAVDTHVTNPLFRVAAAVANTAGRVLGAGPVFEPDGVGVSAEAKTSVE